MYGEPKAVAQHRTSGEWVMRRCKLGGENDERDLRVGLPFPGAAFMLAEQGGKGARNAWLWTASTFGTAGTGKRIAELSGAARYRAALANVGKGPLINGGKGMAGGDARLAKVETAVACTLAAVYLGAVIKINWDHLKSQPAAGATMRTHCEACGASMSATDFDSSEIHCAHRGEDSSAQS